MQKKIDWTNKGIEFITVVFGILLAFWLNNYAQQQKEKKQAQQYLQSIVEEIKSNKVELDQKLPYHKGLLRDLQENPLEARIALKASRVTDFAWQLSNNGIFKEHVDFATYRNLAKVYSMQEQMELNNISTSETMTNLNALTPLYIASGGQEAIDIARDTIFQLEMRRSWVPILQDMVFYEAELLEAYNATLKNIKE